MATATFAQPIYNPRFRAFDAAGNPLSGGKLNTYVGGTVATPQATYPTYADALAGTNANANPVILDANGEATAFGTNAFYKFVLADSTNVTQWTIDNVLLGDVPRSSTTVVKNGNQLAFAASTKIITWTVELDSLGEWSAVNNRWTALYPGRYFVTLSVEAADSVANQDFQAQISKNGAVVGRGRSRISVVTASTVTSVDAYYLWNAAAGDFIEGFAIGTANTTVQGTIGTRLSIIGIGL